MWPVVFSVGPITLYTYGIFLAVAFFLALFVVYKRAKESHFEEEQLIGVAIKCGIAGLIGGRLSYSLSLLTTSHDSWLTVLTQNGVIPMFSLVTAGGWLWRWCRQNKLDYWQVADIMVVAWLLFRAIMTLGDFFNGSGYGNPTTWFIGVAFPGLFDRRIPVQLVEAGLFAGLFTWVWGLESRYRTFNWYRGHKSESREGFLVALSCLFEGIIGILLLPLRPNNHFWWGMATDWFYALILVILGLTILNYRSGWGLGGIYRYTAKSLGLTTTLAEVIQRKKHNDEPLKLGRDIFE